MADDTITGREIMATIGPEMFPADFFVPFTPRTTLTRSDTLSLRELCALKARHPRGRLTPTGRWLYLLDGGMK